MKLTLTSAQRFNIEAWLGAAEFPDNRDLLCAWQLISKLGFSAEERAAALRVVAPCQACGRPQAGEFVNPDATSEHDLELNEILMIQELMKGRKWHVQETRWMYPLRDLLAAKVEEARGKH